ncbi:MAG: hypothetical protein N2379_09645 [Verrucomicrobiae bacterium]|nr:hypothetical protein [Verrucomicrobiae bacterium]
MLTDRWHDHVLELGSVNFDENSGRCVFTVVERSERGAAGSNVFFQKKALQRCRVTVNNVEQVRFWGAKGEAELYINVVETTPSILRVVGGTVRLNCKAIV